MVINGEIMVINAANYTKNAPSAPYCPLAP
jgi:hypothetical protein